MKYKYRIIDEVNKKSDTSIVDYIALTILSLSSGFTSYEAVTAYTYNAVFRYPRALFFSIVCSVICSSYLLITNKRKFMGIFSWILLLLIIILPYYVVIQRYYPSVTIYTIATARNITYSLGVGGFVYLAIMHIVVHGIAWLAKKKRQVFTKNGIITSFIVGLLFFIIPAFSVPLLASIFK